MENKLIIIPIYKDLYKLDKWKEILKDKNYLVYEKDDSLKKDEEIIISKNHIKIFSYGEGTMQFLYHILKNFNNLNDYIIYTKTHWFTSIHNYGTEKLFQEDYKKNKLYFQHTAQRNFLTYYTKSGSSNEFKDELRNFLLKHDINFFNKYELFFDEKNLKISNDCPVTVLRSIQYEIIDNKKKYKCKFCKERFKGKENLRNHITYKHEVLDNEFDKKFNLYKNCIIDPSYTNSKWLNEMMNLFFEDYDQISEFKLHYRDASFTVHKDLIYYHEKYKYEKLFNSYLNNNICRDEMHIFINLLFYETLKRYKKKNKIINIPMNLNNLTHEYFKRWNNKSITELSILFSEDIKLRDWNIDVSGFDDVVQANLNIFKELPNIKAEILKLFVCENKKTVTAELLIHLNNNDKINVVDIITFNDNGKINSIRAFKG